MSFQSGGWVRITLSWMLHLSSLVVLNALQTVLTVVLLIAHNSFLNLAGEKQLSGKNPMISGCHRCNPPRRCQSHCNVEAPQAPHAYPGSWELIPKVCSKVCLCTFILWGGESCWNRGNQRRVLKGASSPPYVVSAKSENTEWSKGVKWGKGGTTLHQLCILTFLPLLKFQRPILHYWSQDFWKHAVTTLHPSCSLMWKQKKHWMKSVYGLYHLLSQTLILYFSFWTSPSSFTNISEIYKGSKQEDQVLQHANAATWN